VYNLEIARLYNYLLQNENTHFAIIHSLDGYDEISLTSDVKAITSRGERVFTPAQLGGMTIDAKEIEGGEKVEDAVKIFMSILDGKGTASQNAVVLFQCCHGIIANRRLP